MKDKIQHLRQLSAGLEPDAAQVNAYTEFFAVLSFHTHLEAIELALEILQQKAKELEKT